MMNIKKLFIIFLILFCSISVFAQQQNGHAYYIRGNGVSNDRFADSLNSLRNSIGQVVHKAGADTITGEKTFSSDIILATNNTANRQIKSTGVYDLGIFSGGNMSFSTNYFSTRFYRGNLANTIPGPNFNINTNDDASLGFFADMPSSGQYRSTWDNPTLIRSNKGNLLFYTDYGIGTSVNYTPSLRFKIDSAGNATFTGNVLATNLYTKTQTDSALLTSAHLAGTETFTGAKNFNNNLNVGTGYEYRYNNIPVIRVNSPLANYFFANSGNTTMTGNDNIGFGLSALYNNTSGVNNSALGFQSMYYNTTGSYNTANGLQSLYTNTTGSYNTAVGLSSLKKNTIGWGNTALGWAALEQNDTASYNIGVGAEALRFNTTGRSNVAVGAQSLFYNQISGYNIGVGNEALFSHKSGNFNIAIGTSALLEDTSGISNIAIGDSASAFNTNGKYNVVIGRKAFLTNTTGSYNIAIGYSSGTIDGSTLQLSDSCTFLGTRTSATFSNPNNSTAIGYNATITKNNQIVFGNSNIVENLFYGKAKYATNPTMTAADSLVATDKKYVDSVFANVGASVASASAITPTGNTFHVTGTTTITSITATNVKAGQIITIIFDGALTFTDGGNLKLAGNFTTSADATITLRYDGTNFYEMSRSVN